MAKLKFKHLLRSVMCKEATRRGVQSVRPETKKYDEWNVISMEKEEDRAIKIVLEEQRKKVKRKTVYLRTRLLNTRTEYLWLE